MFNAWGDKTVMRYDCYDAIKIGNTHEFANLCWNYMPLQIFW